MLVVTKTEKEMPLEAFEIIHTRKWTWAGHVIWRKEEKWTRQVMEWYSRDRTRLGGIPSLEMRRTSASVTLPWSCTDKAGRN